MSMSQKVREELLPRLWQRYAGRGKQGRGVLLDELCEQFGYSRKHAIKMLGAKSGWGGDPAVRSKVLGISAAQIDRLLARRKVREGKGRSGTKPGGLLKTQIPIRTDNWDVDRPGYLEADTVAHCGGSLEGDFVWSVTYTDIASGWTSNRAVWNKGAEGIVVATREVEAQLPFEILGFDCDNGSEFLNWHLVRYFQERPKRVGFTRSRPYHKDDNGHVEEKNWTRVRQLLEYGRFEDPAVLGPLNELYREIWEPLHNFFLPCAKLRGRRAALDPFELHDRLEEGLRRVLHLARNSSRPTASLRCGPNEAILEEASVSFTFEATHPVLGGICDKLGYFFESYGNFHQVFSFFQLRNSGRLQKLRARQVTPAQSGAVR